jgi:hypothetical protein
MSTAEFRKTLADIYPQAYWGKDIDLDLIDAMLRLDEAEAGLIWHDIPGGEAVWESDSEAAEEWLGYAQGELWIAEARLRRKDPAEAHKIIAKHRERIQEHRVAGGVEDVKRWVTATLVDLLFHANGKRPTTADVADLIAALEAAAKGRTDRDREKLLSDTQAALVAKGWDKEELAKEIDKVARLIVGEKGFNRTRDNIMKRTLRPTGLFE